MDAAGSGSVADTPDHSSLALGEKQELLIATRLLNAAVKHRNNRKSALGKARSPGTPLRFFSLLCAHRFET